MGPSPTSLCWMTQVSLKGTFLGVPKLLLTCSGAARKRAGILGGFKSSRWKQGQSVPAALVLKSSCVCLMSGRSRRQTHSGKVGIEPRNTISALDGGAGGQKYVTEQRERRGGV